MKTYSKKWINTFLENELPDNKIIIDEMSKKAFEVESVEETSDGDSLFEIKVLPNRVADAMSLEGMAREFSAVLDNPFKNLRPEIDLEKFTFNNEFIKAGPGVLRLCGFKMTIEKQKETPEWIKDILMKSGGRSINSIADISNLILYYVGQPNHAFDVSKIDGKVSVRHANKGEKLILLGGKEINLQEEDLVVADEKEALDLAGVRGGLKAEVTENSTEFLWIVPNFSNTEIRKASTYHGIRTDSSKIFENGISTDKTKEALGLILATVLEIYPEAKIEFIFDHLVQVKNAKKVTVNTENIRSYAGVNISNKEIKKLLAKQNFETVDLGENKIEVLPPHERLDIEIEEDVSEEVLRLYGFDNIPSKPLELEKNISHDTGFLVESIIKKYLFENSYTEIIGYTFKDFGEVKVKLGLAKDKEFLRQTLIEDLENTFTKNYNFMPLLQMDILKFYEISTVFKNYGEEKHCLIVCDDNKKKSKFLPDLEKIISDLENLLQVKVEILSKSEKPAAIEFSIKNIIEKIAKENLNLAFSPIEKDLQSVKYKPISAYPFIVRDIALFIPENLEESFDFVDLEKNILNLNLQNVEKIYLFDKFTKNLADGKTKTSIAFRIIFQSYEKTLTDVDVENKMKKVYNYLKENNFEIR